MLSLQNSCIFGYQYRDASNYKAYGRLLLSGVPDESTETFIRNCCFSNELFITEQVKIPPLYQDLYQYSDNQPTEDDIAFHEFYGLEIPSTADLSNTIYWGSLSELISNFSNIKYWDILYSPHV